MGIAAKIKSLRTKAGYTQEELAKQLDVNRSTVAQWESGYTTPRVKMIARIADVFGVPAPSLLDENHSSSLPAGATKPVGRSAFVPLVGYTHMGATVDEDTCERMVEVPANVAEAHPNGFCVHADGDCMDNRYPDDSVLMVDPDLAPYVGCAVLAETEDYQSVVRVYSRGSSTLMLAADSHTADYPDIVAGPDDPPVTVRGVVVWYMAERDVRG